MAVGFLNLVRVTLSTTGTGSTLTINAAVSGWLDFVGAGGVNGTVYRYAIIDGNNSEIGTITYNSGTNTLSGRTVTNSTNSGLALNLTTAAILAVSVAGQDLVPGGTNFGTIASQAASAVAITGGTISGISSLGVTGAATIGGALSVFGATNPGGATSIAIPGTDTILGVGGSLGLGANIYFNSGFKYSANGAGTFITLGSTAFSFSTAPVNAGGAGAAAALTGVGDFASTTANTWTFRGTGGVVIDTATGTMLNVTSANTGAVNQAIVQNTGTASNTSTFSVFKAALSGTVTYIQMFMQGGATPIGVVQSTGPLTMSATAGAVTINPSTTLLFQTAGTERARIDNSTGFFNIGPALTPDALLTVNASTANTPGTLLGGTIFHLVGSSGAARQLFDGFANPGQFTFRRADGTISAPSALQNNDQIAVINAVGYGATGYGAGGRASIVALATSSGTQWSDTDQGAYWVFGTASAGTLTNTERMRLNASGGLGIATTTDPGAGNLLVAGTISSNGGSGPPVAAGAAMHMYYLSGSGFLDSVFNGTAWEPMAIRASSVSLVLGGTAMGIGSLGIQSTGGTIISDGAYVTPQMYGAFGNGTTDDTTALSNALNSGKPVWLVGKFKITSAITVNISVAGTPALAVYGGGQWASQILFANNAAKITVNVPYSGDINTSNPSFVLKDFVNVATGAVTIGTAATVNGTSGVISSGTFAGMWSIIGSPTSGNALIGSQAKLGEMSNVGFTTDGTGLISCGLLLQDLRVATFTGLYFPQFSATSWPLVVRPTIQALGNAPNLLVFDKCTGIGGLYGFAVLASGAPIFTQTGTFTTSSANISGTTWTTIGLQLTIPAGTASVPLPFVAGTAYYIVSASGGNIQLSATSGGSPITVTGATHAVALTAQLQDYEGVTFRDCSMIGCANYGLFACGSDGTNNVIVVSDSTWATSAANNGGASGGVYIYGWTGVTVVNNNYECAMTSGTFHPFLIQNNNNVFPFFGAMTGNTAIVPTTLTRSYFFNITGTDSSYHPAGANQIN